MLADKQGSREESRRDRRTQKEERKSVLLQMNFFFHISADPKVTLK